MKKLSIIEEVKILLKEDRWDKFQQSIEMLIDFGLKINNKEITNIFNNKYAPGKLISYVIEDLKGLDFDIEADRTYYEYCYNDGTYTIKKITEESILNTLNELEIILKKIA